MTGQLLKSVLYSKGFGDTIKSGKSLAFHSPDLNLCNFNQSNEDDLRTSTQNTVFSVSPAGVHNKQYVCNV
jgi:hypothetical protein